MTLYNLRSGLSGVWRQARLLAGVLLLGSAALLFVVRATVLAFLLMFQPFVCFVLSAIAVLGVLSAVTIEASATAETFPFWSMMGFALACAMLLGVYHALLRFLSQ